MNFKFSSHALEKHSHEKWNASTIKEIVENGEISNYEFLEGKTADIICGIAPDNSEVGLILSKEKNGERVIITGYSAPISYWESV